MSVNKVILLGYVGSDPELRYPEKDRAIAYLSLATNELRGNTRTEVTNHWLMRTMRFVAKSSHHIV